MDVLLFGIIAERAGSASISVEAGSIQELQQELITRIPGMQALSYTVAVDRIAVYEDRVLRGTEEIAILPPFAGG